MYQTLTTPLWIFALSSYLYYTMVCSLWGADTCAWHVLVPFVPLHSLLHLLHHLLGLSYFWFSWVRTWSELGAEVYVCMSCKTSSSHRWDHSGWHSCVRCSPLGSYCMYQWWLNVTWEVKPGWGGGVLWRWPRGVPVSLLPRWCVASCHHALELPAYAYGLKAPQTESSVKLSLL